MGRPVHRQLFSKFKLCRFSKARDPSGLVVVSMPLLVSTVLELLLLMVAGFVASSTTHMDWHCASRFNVLPGTVADASLALSKTSVRGTLTVFATSLLAYDPAYDGIIKNGTFGVVYVSHLEDIQVATSDRPTPANYLLYFPVEYQYQLQGNLQGGEVCTVTARWSQFHFDS